MRWFLFLLHQVQQERLMYCQEQTLSTPDVLDGDMITLTQIGCFQF